ncbi:hypothetical protein D3C75_685920 [compost metagenome]
MWKVGKRMVDGEGGEKGRLRESCGRWGKRMVDGEGGEKGRLRESCGGRRSLRIRTCFFR